MVSNCDRHHQPGLVAFENCFRFEDPSRRQPSCSTAKRNEAMTASEQPSYSTTNRQGKELQDNEQGDDTRSFTEPSPSTIAVSRNSSPYSDALGEASRHCSNTNARQASTGRSVNLCAPHQQPDLFVFEACFSNIASNQELGSESYAPRSREQALWDRSCEAEALIREL